MTDIAILGGGLAGLTLALQLREQLPDANIKVLERQQHPVPEAAHKVGESTVEIGAHYLANVVGLKDHLQNDQLRKYGLRFFFEAGQAEDLSHAAELGASHLLTIPSYQVDRGILENHLATRVQEADIELVNGATVTNVSLSEENEPHRVHYRIDGRIPLELAKKDGYSSYTPILIASALAIKAFANTVPDLGPWSAGAWPTSP